MKYALLIVFIILNSCKDDAIVYPDGGYAFINTDTIKDKSFPYFPIRDSIDIYDSLASIFEETTIRTLFNEPNISLKASKNPIFRLSIGGFGIPYYFFILIDGKIIAKKSLTYEIYTDNKSKLTALELFHYEFLSMHSPMVWGAKDTSIKTRRKYYADSLVKIYPSLKSIPYFIYLFKKANYPLSKSFKYETRYISLPDSVYISLIEKINKSGYWRFPLHIGCSEYGFATDGYGFSLEANYGKKYNHVGSPYCRMESSKFSQVCQEIINLSQYENEIILDYPTSKKNN